MAAHAAGSTIHTFCRVDPLFQFVARQIQERGNTWHTRLGAVRIPTSQVRTPHGASERHVCYAMRCRFPWPILTRCLRQELIYPAIAPRFYWLQPLAITNTISALLPHTHQLKSVSARLVVPLLIHCGHSLATDVCQKNRVIDLVPGNDRWGRSVRESSERNDLQFGE